MPDQPSNPDDAKRAWFEPVTAVLMAVAPLSTAWCSYQSSLWGGQSGGFETRADKLEREATAMHLGAQQSETVHVRAVMEVDATLAGNEKLARLFTNRFGAELKPAYEKWSALKPFENPGAPPHPFVPALYTPAPQQEIRAAMARAAQAEGHPTSPSPSSSSVMRWSKC